MKRLITMIALAACISGSDVSATIINIPGDYQTIQQGIDASADGDTVLVQPGTYVENVNFNGHNIVLGSLFLTTGDTSYIEQTVIDGGAQGPVLSLRNGEDSTTVIIGLRIQNGRNQYSGAGILCWPASPRIIRNVIADNYSFESGGGIYARSALTISSNSIHDNYAYDGGGIYVWGDNYVIDSNIVVANSGAPSYGHYGGGVYASGPGLIRGNIIYNNSGASGSGLGCRGPHLCVVGNLIISNFSGDGRAAVYCYSCDDDDIVIENCVLWNEAVTEVDNDGDSSADVRYSIIRSGYPGTGNLSAHPLILDPLNQDFNVCSQSPCIDAGDPNIYDPDGTRSDIGIFFPEHPECFTGTMWNISMSGDDDSGNGSPENPFRTIQRGIDTSLYGDTVLVHSGIYEENIRIEFKNIAILSEYHNSGRFEDIQNTILDGDSLGRACHFSLCDSQTTIEGITVRNGASYGISCYYADPVIENNIVIENEMGISCLYSNPRINSNIIAHNRGESYGGGISCLYSNPIIMNNTISGNSPCGIEIALDYSVIISNCIIWANAPLELNIHGIHTVDMTYSDIRGGYDGEGNIDANPLFVDAFNRNFNLCMQSPCIDAGNPDMMDPDGSRIDMGVYFPEHPECDLGGDRLYVSTAGNDSSGDGSENNPFRTIQHGVNMSYQNDTIIVENGLYEENVVVHDKSVVLASEFLCTEDWNDVFNTVIDGHSNSGAVTLENCDSASSVIGFTISNGYSQYGGGIFCNASNTSVAKNVITQNTATFGGGICFFYSNSMVDDNIINNNIASIGGSGVHCYGSPIQMANNYVYDNSRGGYGGGISLNHSDALIIDNRICDNSVTTYGGGLWCNESDAQIINNLISGNTAGYYGGGIGSRYSNPFILNTIFWGDSALTYPNTSEIYVHTGNSPVIHYSDIEGGYEGQGNIDVDPLFRDPENGVFHLMSIACGDSYDSPCIDAGHPDIIDSLLDCAWGLGELRSDMGAYGGGDSASVGIDQDEIRMPHMFSISQNYPNPFNASTIIRYALPHATHVNIGIFDILGRSVEIIVDKEQRAGYHQAVWNAVNRPSGIYFYTIEAADKAETRKMILLK